MPKAAVNKYHGLELWKDNVRLSWQTRIVFSEPEPLGKEVSANNDFRASLFSRNARHDFTSLFRGKDICHLVSL
jgi:hypothetical protein